jgi:phosphatidylinositol alpha-1,6-mannosyltransferase
VLRRIASGLDVLTCISDYTRDRLAPALGAVTRMAQLSPGVDVDRFTPDADGAAVRARYGLGAAPVVVCVSRLVPARGRTCWWRPGRRCWLATPTRRLLLVGGGPLEDRLAPGGGRARAGAPVVLTGPVPPEALPEHYAAGDVFAMPCRTRRGGLDVEGLGMVYLEAAACGRRWWPAPPAAPRDGAGRRTGHVGRPALT